MGREEGGGFRMGNTCIPVADSFWYLAKLIQFVKFKNKIKFKKFSFVSVLLSITQDCLAKKLLVYLFNLYFLAAATAFPSRPTLCDPIDSIPPASLIPGIFQARRLEWVATSFSNEWRWKVKVKSLSHVRLFTTPRTAAYQAPLPMGFSRQEDLSGVPLPSLLFSC